jgi:CDP-diglyceride synthetase
MQPVLLLKLLVLLAVANGTPLFAKKLLGDFLAHPVDGGLLFIDQRRLFGASKTIRGVVLALALTAVAAPWLGLDIAVGLAVGAAAMAGDLFSSFGKRRAGLPPSARATGLDQVPEALLPLLVCCIWLDLSLIDVAVGVAAFFLGEIVLSRLLHQLHLREQPY